MRQTHKTLYRTDSIEYWPYHSSSMIAICYGVGLILISMLLLVWFVLDSTSVETICGTIVLSCVAITISIVVIVHAQQKLYTKIVITQHGISVSNMTTHDFRSVNWDDVSCVKILQDPWYGRKTYCIYLKRNIGTADTGKKKADYILPASIIDDQIVEAFIPTHLFAK